MKDAIYDLTYELEETYWWYAARRGVILDRVCSLLANRSGGERSRILEYGCGTGITLASLAPTADVYGMDMSEKALDYCRKRGLANLHRIDTSSPLERGNPFGESFDVILLVDVLEHVEDEQALLLALRSWLKPDGALLVTAPAFQFLWSGEDFVSNHLRRYAKSRLRRVIQRAGFAIVRDTYFNFFLFPIQAGVILLNRFFHPRSMTQTNLISPPRIVNSLLTRIMSAERPLLKVLNFPFGGSILTIARPINYNE